MGVMKLCRLCAQEKEKCIEIYNEEGQKLKLSTKIIQCLQICVHPEDVLPTLICVDCCGKLNQSSEFFETSSQAQVALQNVLKVNNKVQQVSNNGPDHLKHVLPEKLKKSRSRNRKNKTLSEPVIPILEDNVGLDPPPSPIVSDSSVSAGVEDVGPTLRSNYAKSKPSRVRLEESYSWHCTDCTAVLGTPQQLQEHHRTVHAQPVRYQCVECSKVYTVYRKFSRHVRLHRNHGKFSCNECNKGFSTKQALSNHAVLHSNTRPHSCPECGKTFRQIGSLYCHRRSHQPEEGKYPCPDCGKRLLSRQALEYHRKTHTGARDYTCEVCGKSFTVKQALAYHLMSHSGERPYSCRTCDKTFKTVYLLNKHSSVHSDVKAHQCDVCGKQFRERSTLKLHGRIHTGAMPYQCEFCKKRFRFQGVYVIHRRQHTGERPYSCPECRRDFTNWANYNKHVKCRHGGGSTNKRAIKPLSSNANPNPTQSANVTDSESLTELNTQRSELPNKLNTLYSEEGKLQPAAHNGVVSTILVDHRFQKESERLREPAYIPNTSYPISQGVSMGNLLPGYFYAPSVSHQSGMESDSIVTGFHSKIPNHQ